HPCLSSRFFRSLHLSLGDPQILSSSNPEILKSSNPEILKSTSLVWYPKLRLGQRERDILAGHGSARQVARCRKSDGAARARSLPPVPHDHRFPYQSRRGRDSRTPDLDVWIEQLHRVDQSP